MNAKIIEQGEHTGTIQAPPFSYQYDGDDPRVKSVLQTAEQMVDTESVAPETGDVNASSPREREVEATPEQRFRNAVARIEGLGHWVQVNG